MVSLTLQLPWTQGIQVHIPCCPLSNVLLWAVSESPRPPSSWEGPTIHIYKYPKNHMQAEENNHLFAPFGSHQHASCTILQCCASERHYWCNGIFERRDQNISWKVLSFLFDALSLNTLLQVQYGKAQSPRDVDDIVHGGMNFIFEWWK